MKYTFTALALAAVTAAAPLEVARDSVTSPPAFKITNVISGGTGCPQGSVDINWTNSQVLPFYFGPQFTARVGKTAEPEDSRKNCQLNLALEYSPGFSFAVYNADFTGFFAADSGVTGIVKSTYYFSGETDQTSAALTLQGPYYGRYTKSDDLALAVWSPCGGKAGLNINSAVSLTPFTGNANGILTSNKESGRFSNNVYVRWRQC